MAEGNYNAVQILSQLVSLLRRNGDKILNGDCKFCLTTQGLTVLNSSFRRYSEIDCVVEPEYLTRRKNVRQEILMEKWKENICFLHDFVVKTISLKIIHGSLTVQSPVILSRFRNLQCLEVKKVPVHMLEGLQVLRSQLQTLIVSRCLQNIEDLLETCGGDQSSPMSWPKLKWCSLNYNNITKLDESLRLANELEILELSHNYICKTEEFLQYLTGIQRVNLGFNQIDSVPTFSLSSKANIRTLVLRNNNLDNLEGIEELTGLEELDVSENCLSDHRLLSVLLSLHKLQLLNLIGNPLSYHDHHRLITVSYISHSALRKNFFLDKKRVKSSEIVFQAKKKNIESKWHTSCSQSVSSVTDSAVSDVYQFDDTDSIAESLRVNSPITSTTRKSRRKTKQYFRGSEYSTDTSSRESSRGPSPDRSDLAGSYNTRQKIEILRHHYGENWLQAYTTQHGSPLTTSENKIHSTSDCVVMRDSGKTDDDYYLNDTSDKVNAHEDDFVVLNDCVHNNDKQQAELVAGIKQIALDDDGVGVVEVSSDSDAKIEKDVKVTSPSPVYTRMNSAKGIEWTRSELEQQQLHGPESDPFICHLMITPTNICPVIISVNDRYIIEKDLNGSVIEMLDVKCMETLEEMHDYVSHEDFGDNVLLPVIVISFDYVKKDRQKRSYIMEDVHASKQLLDLLQPSLDRKRSEKTGQKLQCLKCSKIFFPSEAKLVDEEYISLKKLYSSSSEDYQTKYSCPGCKSGMVVRLDLENVSQTIHATPVGSATSASSPSEAFIKQLRISFSTSTPRNSPKRHSVAFASLGPKENSEPRTWNSNDDKQNDLDSGEKSSSQRLSDDKKHSQTTSSRMRHNASFPDLRRASTGHIGGHRQRMLSEESDISVIRSSSQSSIAAASETSVDTMTERVSQNDADKNFLPSVNKSPHFTPVGSPLSTGVCSSMVSSVYENTLTLDGENEANISKHSEDVQSEGTAENVESIYNSEHLNDNDNEKERLGSNCNFKDSSNDNSFMGVSTSINTSHDVIKDGNLTLDNSDNLTLNTEEFTDVDHRLKLYFMMHLFEDDDDSQCFIECDIVQYKVKSLYRGILLVSMKKVFILKIKDGAHRNEAPDVWLTHADSQAITEVQYIDIGLGYQSFRLEFSTENLCYTFIIRDEGRCKKFLSLLTGIVQSFAFNDKSKLKGISKYNATTSENLWQQVLWRDGESDDLDGVVNIEEEKLVKYLMAHLIDGSEETPSPVSMVVTATEICLVIENHQYLPPRSITDTKKPGSRGTQFQLKEIQKINNIATVELADEDLKQLRITFFNEESSEERCWHIVMETTNGILSLVEAIREPWESEFGVDLEVTKTSFHEESSF